MADIYLEKDLQSPAAVTAFDSDPTVFGGKYFDSGRHFLVSLTVANGNLVLQGEALRRADAICIWSGRPLFWGPQAKADTPGKAGGAWQGGYLMYFGSNVVRFVEHFEPKGVVLAGLSTSGAEPLTKYQIERFKASLLALEPAEQGCRQGTGKGDTTVNACGVKLGHTAGGTNNFMERFRIPVVIRTAGRYCLLYLCHLLDLVEQMFLGNCSSF